MAERTPEARAKQAEAQTRYRLKNPDRYNEINRASRLKKNSYSRWQLAWRKRNPDKKAAQNKASKAILRSRKLLRPDKCDNCGRECKPQGHHRDYAKPLEITWLCRPCHLAEHGYQARVFVEGDPK